MFETCHVTDDEVVTVKDMCQILMSDIKDRQRKETMHYLVCESINIALKNSQYKKLLEKKPNQSISQGILEIFKKQQFRKDLIHILTMSIIIKMKLPKYVILYGTDFH